MNVFRLARLLDFGSGIREGKREKEKMDGLEPQGRMEDGSHKYIMV